MECLVTEEDNIKMETGREKFDWIRVAEDMEFLDQLRYCYLLKMVSTALN
jgi:hypothetical protein